MADIHQRVISLEERAQAHETGFGQVRKDIADLRQEIVGMRSEMAHRSEVAELRTEIAWIRGEMVHRSDLADLRNDMNQRFAAVDQKFTWLVGIQVAGLVAVIGALVGSYYQ